MAAVLVVNICVVEEGFGIHGSSALSLFAVDQRDLPLILGTTIVIAFVGIAANFLQDVAYSLLDPRVREEGR